MKKLFAFIFVFMGYVGFVAAAESLESKYDLMIELGEDHSLKEVHQKVWIENPKIFSATANGSSVMLKALALGYSKVKVDQKEISVLAVPTGFKDSYKMWLKLVRKMPNLQIAFCEQTICLQGEIFSLTEFVKIVDLMEVKKSYLFLKLDFSDKLSVEIEKWYVKYFRNHEITPPKIVFNSTPWKAVLSLKDDSASNNRITHQVGLFTQENKNKLEISDNIKVSVKFIEVKKSFARTLGVRWNTDITGQLADGALNTEQNISLMLAAGESSGDTKLIASPNLVCRNGKEAEFLAGGEIPFKVVNRQSKELIWKKYGIHLKIKPQVDPLGQMSIEIDTEVSTPDFSFSVDGLPTLHTNKVSSHFDLVKSKTIIISGLIQNGISNSKEGLPFLTQIPILGKLFSSQSFLEDQTELVILVTPEIYE